MLLIIGAMAAGKRTFAQKLGYSPEQMADGVLNEQPVIFHVENLVREKSGETEQLFDILRKKEVVICAEVGLGIVPLDKEERQIREETGRLCLRLGQEADTVVRMVCGIPTLLKGDWPC